MKKDQPAGNRPTTPFEEPGQDESGKTSAPQSAPGPSGTKGESKAGGAPPADARPAKANVGDDDAAEGT